MDNIMGRLFFKELRFAGFLFFLLGCYSVKPTEKSAQIFLKQDAIAGSQAGASPLFFDPGQDEKILFSSKFNDSRELVARNGLPGFASKIQKKMPVTIAFIGGSVTQMDNKYRNQTARMIRSLYPHSTIKFMNAGVSGSGTDLGACRIGQQVLKFHPDLIFIEFAVNGSYLPGLEGMIRQIIKSDPYTDICLLYAIMKGQSALYAAGKLPDNIVQLETIASYYKLPAIFLGLEPSLLEASGKLIFMPGNKNNSDLPVFSDGIHPTPYGGYIYTGAIKRSLQKMVGSQKEPVKHALPPPMIKENWEDAKMLRPEEVTFSKEWQKIDTKSYQNLKQFTPWFPYVMSTDKPGASFSFSFTGSKIGIFDIGGPEVGQLTVIVDGKKIKALNRFNSWCNNRYRGQYDFIDLDPGFHTVRFEISSEIPDKKAILGPAKSADINANPDKYHQRIIYIGKILIRGELKN